MDNREQYTKRKTLILPVAIALGVIVIVLLWNISNRPHNDNQSKINEPKNGKVSFLESPRNIVRSEEIENTTYKADAGSSIASENEVADEAELKSSPVVDLDIIDEYMSRSAGDPKAERQMRTQIKERAERDKIAINYEVDCRGLVCKTTLIFNNETDGQKYYHNNFFRRSEDGPYEENEYAVSMEENDKNQSAFILTVYQTAPGYKFAEVISRT